MNEGVRTLEFLVIEELRSMRSDNSKDLGLDKDVGHWGTNSPKILESLTDNLHNCWML
jgi:hypothetical protein